MPMIQLTVLAGAFTPGGRAGFQREFAQVLPEVLPQGHRKPVFVRDPALVLLSGEGRA